MPPAEPTASDPDDPLSPEARERVDYLLASDFLQEHHTHDVVMNWNIGEIGPSVLRCRSCSKTWPEEEDGSSVCSPLDEVACVRPGEWAWFQKKTPTKMVYLQNELDATRVDPSGMTPEEIRRMKRVSGPRGERLLFLMTQSGRVWVEYPTWLAVDADGYPYPISPEEHTKTYKPAATTDKCSGSPCTCWAETAPLAQPAPLPRKSFLPKNYMQEGLDLARGAKLYGTPLERLSRLELLAATAQAFHREKEARESAWEEREGRMRDAVSRARQDSSEGLRMGDKTWAALQEEYDKAARPPVQPTKPLSLRGGVRKPSKKWYCKWGWACWLAHPGGHSEPKGGQDG